MRITSPQTLLAAVLLSASAAIAQDWKADPVWHDGLVEKATYHATRVVYGKPRAYESVFFTNKEQHDRRSWTKAEASKDTVEVFKHNQVEVIPTPNYEHKYVTTSHITTGNLLLTRLDVSSQEFCGTSFKQYQITPGGGLGPAYKYFGFSYLPESGRVEKTVEVHREVLPIVAFNSLPIVLRDFDFATRKPLKIYLLPDQKSNSPPRPIRSKPRRATPRKKTARTRSSCTSRASSMGPTGSPPTVCTS